MNLEPSAVSTTPSPSLQAIPNCLRSLKRWIRWRWDSDDKRPCAWDSGHWTDYHTQNEWRAFADVCQHPKVNDSGTGVSFAQPIILDGHRLLALDLDACRCKDTGTIEPWAKELIDHCKRSYTEVTPSGQGLRIWVKVKHYPEMRKTDFTPRLLTRAPGTTKQVECQVFGGKSPGFVTVTGSRLPNVHQDVLEIENLDWWGKVFTLGATDGPIKNGTHELPKGIGEPPALAVVRDTVRSTERGRLLMDRAWQGKPGYENWKSNSEAFAALENEVVRAAHWHGDLALRFLLQECPRWSDPGVRECYSREDWVKGDLLRVAPSRPPFEALEVLDEAEGVEGVEGVRPAKVVNTEGLLVPAGEFGKQAAQQMFLVKGLIARTGVTQFFGDPASGKTPFVMSLALAVASGQGTWFGHRVLRKGLVIYMVGEDRAGVGHRLLAECKVRGLDPDELGKTLLFTSRPGQLMSAEDTQRWVEAIRKAQEVAGGMEVALVVIDTQAQNFGPGDENAFKDMNQFLHNLEAMSNMLDCSLTMVHHTGHMNKDRGRGHSAMEGFVSSRFEVVKSETESGAVVTTATDHKHKNWEQPEALRGTLVPVVRYKDEDGDPVTAITLREDGGNLFDNEEEVVAVVTAVAKMGADASIRAVAADTKLSRRAAESGLRKAVVAGLIKVSGAEFSKRTYSLTALGVESVSERKLGVARHTKLEPINFGVAQDEWATLSHLGLE